MAIAICRFDQGGKKCRTKKKRTTTTKKRVAAAVNLAVGNQDPGPAEARAEAANPVAARKAAEAAQVPAAAVASQLKSKGELRNSPLQSPLYY